MTTVSQPPQPDATQGRVCTKCNEYKPFSEFYRQSKTKTGYQERCKPCSEQARRRSKTHGVKQPQRPNNVYPAARIVGMALGALEVDGRVYAYRLLVDCPNGHEDILHLRENELRPFHQVPCGVCRQTYSLPDPKEVG